MTRNRDSDDACVQTNNHLESISVPAREFSLSDADVGDASEVTDYVAFSGGGETTMLATNFRSSSGTTISSISDGRPKELGFPRRPEVTPASPSAFGAEGGGFSVCAPPGCCPTPWGLSPSVLIAVYFIIVCMTGQAVGATDPLQEMMKMAGVYADLENPVERDIAIKRVAGFGLSIGVLCGAFVGIVLNAIGPRMTAVIGLFLQAYGYIAMYFCTSPIILYSGSFALGIAFQSIFNAHVGIAALFPKNPAFVLSLIGSAPDISLFIPQGMKMLSQLAGGGPAGVRYVMTLYIAAVLSTCLFFDLVFLPFRVFEPPMAAPLSSNTPTDQKSTAVLTQVDLAEPLLNAGVSPHQSPTRPKLIYISPGTNNLADSRNISFSANSPAQLRPKTALSAVPVYWKESAFKQCQSLHFWVFAPFFVLAFCRKKHFAMNCRSSFLELANGDDSAAEFYTEMFNSFVPIGCIPACLWGLIVDTFGCIFVMFAVNVFGAIFSAGLLVSNMKFQAVTIISSILNGSFVFGIGFAYCSYTFGFRTLSTIQGVLSTFAGLMSLVMDRCWPYVIEYLGSYTRTNFVILISSLLMFLVPISLMGLKVPMQVLSSDGLTGRNSLSQWDTAVTINGSDRHEYITSPISVPCTSEASIVELDSQRQV